MIQRITEKTELSFYKKTDLFSIRILSLLNAYSTDYDFAVFYKQIDSHGNVTAIISKLDNEYTLSYNSNADLTELADFFTCLGYNSVLSDNAFELGGDFESGVLMKSDKKIELTDRRQKTVIDDYPKLMDIFNIEDYDKSDFESWYVDLSHRIRHGCSRAYTLSFDGEIVSSGIFSSFYNDDAVLTAVRTSPLYRRKGFGSLLVSTMICDVIGDVYLMREADKNENFYKKLGFENIGFWRMYK